MKYASSYKQAKYNKYLDEIHYSKISQIIEQYKNKKISHKNNVLEILKVGSVNFGGTPATNEIYHDLIQKYTNLDLEFYELEDLFNYIKDYPDEAPRLRFHFPADNYNMINTLLAYNINHIILDEPLVFDVARVSTYIKYKNENCQIHIRPYIGKPGYMPKEESILHHFWILPQYIDLYEEYIDYIDLFSETEQREEQLIKNFCISKDYDNLLAPLVLYHAPTDMDMHSDMVTDDMAKRRVNCRQICMSTVPQRCHMCDTQLLIFQQLRRGHHRTKSQS